MADLNCIMHFSNDLIEYFCDNDGIQLMRFSMLVN